jgi:hypothetical protein
MKTMDRTARLAMLPDHEIFCVDLTEGEYRKCFFSGLQQTEVLIIFVLLCQPKMDQISSSFITLI